jgi:hypothetical protein
MVRAFTASGRKYSVGRLRKGSGRRTLSVAIGTILERIIKRKDGTMRAGSLGSRNEKAVNRFGYRREVPVTPVVGGFESNSATVSSLKQVFCTVPVKGIGLLFFALYGTIHNVFRDYKCI